MGINSVQQMLKKSMLHVSLILCHGFCHASVAEEANAARCMFLQQKSALDDGIESHNCNFH